jgi:deazaflavin-dependent oxidoreductase (nitroreductase family)
MRLIDRMGRTRWFARIGPKVIPKFDRAVHWLTRGKVIPSALYVPALLLTATGRKSGLPRTVPLACLPHDGSLIVVASNFGREHHPAWSENLLANPEAIVEFRHQKFPVNARLADAAEKDALWPRILKIWPNFDTYAERSGRDLRVFVLERTGPPAG